MVNDFEEEVKALEEYGHDCCARIDDRIHECCKRIREAHEQELDNMRCAYEISMALMKKQPSPVTYDVLGNERHKAVCKLREMPDGYPDYSAFPFAKWYKDLSLALGIGDGVISCARVRDTLIHLLGGDQAPVALGHLYGISKEGDDGVDARRRVETGGGRSDAAADGHMADCTGNPLAEGVAPITTELRAACGSANDMVSYAAIDSHDFDRLCDAIDAVHAQLERENAELRERVAVLDNADGNMHDGWIRLPLDADGVPIHIGDVMEWPTTHETFEVVGIGDGTLFYIEDGSEQADWTGASTKNHHHAPTVEDVLTEFGIDWEHESDCEDRAALLAKYAAKLRLAGSDAE